MKRYILLLFVICGIALAAIMVLRPSPEIRFEATLSRLEPEDALAAIDAARGTIDFNDNLRLAHAHLALGSGELDKARESLLNLVARTGPQPLALDQLAQIEALSGNMTGAAARLRQAYETEPTAERRQTLGYWLRVLRDANGEMAVLESVPPQTLSGWERERLMQLLISASRLDAYRTMLATMAEAGGEDVVKYRVRLLEFLIEAGESDRALETALRWHLDDPQDADLLRGALRTLIGRGAIAEASVLAWRALERHPDVGPTLVTTLMGSGHGGFARQIQAAWLQSDGSLSRPDWDALAFVAEISGDLDGLRHALLLHGSAALDSGDLPPHVFLQFLRYQGARSLLPYRAYLTPALLQDVPLVAAAWASLHGQPRSAYASLLAASEGSLTDWDRSIWMSIAQEMRGTPFYQALLQHAVADEGLRARLRNSVLSPVAAHQLE